MPASPLDFARSARKWIRGYTPTGKFAEACALVIGFDSARERGMLDGFQEWLGARHGGRSELMFWYNVLAEAFPDHKRSVDALGDDEHARAVDVLFELLEAQISGADPLEYELSS